ncbi:MAG: hypothetical protein PHE21_02400 [Candidatus Dojkabacteria bacterium]|nr:hypothetical protein [Candidatus Dojkabacteria bacterium]
MKITATQFVSNDKDKNTFISVFKHYSNLTEKKVSKEGDIYALLSISGSGELPAERVSKFVWDGIVDGYLYSNAKSTNESLKDSIKEGIRKVKDLIKNDKSVEDVGININFVVIAQKEEGLYIGNFGENEIYIYKENRFVNIFKIMKKKKSTVAGIALGQDDILIVSTYGLITEAMSNFMGLKNGKEVLNSLDNFGKQILNSEGMIYFVSREGEKEGKKIEVKADITKDIPAPRVKLPKKTDGGKKLKEIISKISIRFKSIIEKVKSFFVKRVGLVKDKFQGLLSKTKQLKKPESRKDSVKGMRIDGYKRKDLVISRVKKLVLVALGIILLAVSITLIVNGKKARDRHNLAIEAFESIGNLLDKAEENIVLDIDSSETYLFQAGKLFENIPTQLNDEDSVKLKELEGRKLSLEDTVYKRVPVEEEDGSLTKFTDHRLTFGEGSNPTDIELYKDTSGKEYLIVTDPGLKKVHTVSLKDIEKGSIPDNDGLIKDPLYVSLGNTGVFVYDSKSGVVRATFKDSGFDKFVALSGLGQDDIDAEDIVEMIVLAEDDNVYLLSRDKSSLLKSGFSYENRYNLSFQYIDNNAFANATDVDADISVYFSSTDEPKLIRYVYSQYEQQQIFSDMQTVGFDGNYGNITKLFTYGSGGLYYDLYLFDSEGKRFLRMEKPIESGSDKRHAGQILLKSQIVYRGTDENMWSDVRDFVVDSNQSAMYILEGSSIWKVVL